MDLYLDIELNLDQEIDMDLDKDMDLELKLEWSSYLYQRSLLHHHLNIKQLLLLQITYKTYQHKQYRLLY